MLRFKVRGRQRFQVMQVAFLLVVVEVTYYIGT